MGLRVDVAEIHRVTRTDALEISSWVYPPPYAVYSSTPGDAMTRELVDKEYYGAYDDRGRVFGFYCFGEPARVPCESSLHYYSDTSYIDIGLGLRPDLCGKRLGPEFFSDGLDFAGKTFGTHLFRLTVITLNLRAVKIYRNYGFEEIGSFSLRKRDYSLPFIVMLRTA